MRENDIDRPSYLLPPKCDCPCPTVEPKCDCYSPTVDKARYRCFHPITSQFYCKCCERTAPNCFRVQGTTLKYICRDCETHQVETGTTGRAYGSRWWDDMHKYL